MHNKSNQSTILRHGILLELDLLQLCEINVQNKKRDIVFEILFSWTDQKFFNLVQLGFFFFTEILGKSAFEFFSKVISKINIEEDLN